MSKKVNIDTVFVARVQQLINVCGSGNKAAKYVGVAPGFLSMIKNGYIGKLAPETFERFNLLFGKDLDEIKIQEKEILKNIKVQRDEKAKKDQELAEKRHQEILAIDKRVSDIKIGKRYSIDFYPDQTGKKTKSQKFMEGKVIEIHKRLFLTQTKNFRTTVLKKDVKYGLVTMTEVWKYK